MPESEYQFDNYAGQLQPGDTGWLPIDKDGYPSGKAILEAPPSSPELRLCPVSLTHDGHLVSSSGAVLEPPLNPQVDKRTGAEPKPPIQPLTLTSLNPTMAMMTDPDFTLECIGTGFTTNSVIVFNNGDELTQYVNPTKLTTGVKPSMVSVPISVPVMVRDGTKTTVELEFEFEADLTGAGETRRRR